MTLRNFPFLFACLLALPSTATAGAKLQVSDETFLNIDYLLQAQGQFIEKAAPDKKSWGKDFFLRRSRIILSGDLIKNISFFMETEQANFGKGGDWDKPFFVQDAFMTFKFLDEIMIDAGMIIVPFTRHGFQGAVGLNGLDYHGSLIKYPDGSHKVWRDAGLQFRGYILDKSLSYRVGVFSGTRGTPLQKDKNGTVVASSNPKAWPRTTAQVRYNVFGTETDFFGKGIYFASDPILSFGVSVDFQKDAVLKTPATFDTDGTTVKTAAELTNYLAIGGDVFLDWPIGTDMEAVFQGTFVKYDFGAKAANTGMGVFGEAGFRWKFLEPVIGFDWFKSDGTAADQQTLHAGVNGWIKGHGANVKAEFTMDKKGDMGKAPWIKGVTLQSQFYF